MGYTNIMHDKRVVRGSNFAKKPYVSYVYEHFEYVVLHGIHIFI